MQINRVGRRSTSPVITCSNRPGTGRDLPPTRDIDPNLTVLPPHKMSAFRYGLVLLLYSTAYLVLMYSTTDPELSLNAWFGKVSASIAGLNSNIPQ
jgi:hypothetical protein